MSHLENLISYTPYDTPPFLEAHRKAMFAAEQGGKIEPIHHAIGHLSVQYDMLSDLDTAIRSMKHGHREFARIDDIEQFELSDSQLFNLTPWGTFGSGLVVEAIVQGLPLFCARVQDHAAQLDSLYPQGLSGGIEVTAGAYRFSEDDRPHRDSATEHGSITYTSVVHGPLTTFSSAPFFESEFDGEYLRGPLQEPTRTYKQGDMIVHAGAFTPHAAPDERFNDEPRIFFRLELSPKK